MDYFSRYLPNTEEDCKQMLQAVGLDKVENLFDSIPENCRLTEPLKLPDPLSEYELLAHLQNLQSPILTSFLGGGAYHHFIPSIIPHLVSRSELYTAYTPYQPEINQGTLQALFEYQTLMCQLTGMEVSNASMYDGASSLAESVLMSARVNKRRKILISQAVHPEYRNVINTYVNSDQHELLYIPYQKEDGRTDPEMLFRLLDKEVSCVVIQSPNFFGVIENLPPISDMVHSMGALMVVAFNEAVAYGILKPPGECGADIVAGEGQSLGIPLSYGGPHLGIFTTREQFLRNMPGRLVGETVDLEGKRGFVLTLAAREQHIRRERATSNICTNESLCALMATIYLASLGKQGLRELALMNLSKSEYAKDAVSGIRGCKLTFSSPTYNEFVLEIEGDVEKVLRKLQEERILGGLALGKFFPEFDHHLLIAITEVLSKEEIERWSEILETALR